MKSEGSDLSFQVKATFHVLSWSSSGTSGRKVGYMCAPFHTWHKYEASFDDSEEEMNAKGKFKGGVVGGAVIVLTEGKEEKVIKGATLIPSPFDEEKKPVLEVYQGFSTEDGYDKDPTVLIRFKTADELKSFVNAAVEMGAAKSAARYKHGMLKLDWLSDKLEHTAAVTMSPMISVQDGDQIINMADPMQRDAFMAKVQAKALQKSPAPSPTASPKTSPRTWHAAHPDASLSPKTSPKTSRRGQPTPFCGQCGSKNVDLTPFCPQCGNKC